jgi:hypothetical protein
MQKKFFISIIILAVLSCFVSKSQTSLELSGGLNFNPVTKPLELLPYFDQPSLFHLGLRKNIGSSDSFKYRLGINFGRSRDFVISYSTFLINVGVEKSILNLNSFSIFVAPDFIVRHRVYSKYRYRSETAVGLGPVLGFRQHITNRFSISTEFNFDITYSSRRFGRKFLFSTHRFLGLHINYLIR